MSLRARLLIGLVALAAAGIFVVDAVTYGSLRSFLLDRVDQQLVAAQVPVARALGLRPPGAPAPPGGRPPLSVGREPSDGPGVPGEPDGGRGGPGGPREQLPPGTYGERRDTTGRTVRRVSFSYGQPALARPKLPRNLAAASPPRRPSPTTVDAVGGSDMRYRVAAFRPGGSGSVVVVAVPLRETDQTLRKLLTIELLVTLAGLAALAGAGWLIVRTGLRPLDRIGETAGAIAAGDLTRRVSPADERTEVGRLGLSLNAMLGQIERAFAEREATEEELRRFLADASHELRTPLASIRGYAELFNMGAAGDRAEIAKAMRRIEEESARMGKLVEDLMALARLDQVREPVRERVDLAAVARDACDDARALDPDRAIELSSIGEGAVLGDADQLRQVAGNLLGNALAHTPAGTPVEVSVARDDRNVLLEVRDHGPGLSEEAAAHAFDRFWRSDPARGRGPAGAGLGLAIVAGIVAAHRGSAEALRATGGGAIFAVRLPAA